MQQVKQPLVLSGHVLAVDPLTVVPPDTNGYLPSYGDTAYIPSSTLRHNIRVHAFRVIRDALLQKGVTLSPFVSGRLINGIGGDNGEVTWESEQKIRAANPFVSLFGLWKLNARLAVGNAYGKKGNFSKGEPNDVVYRAKAARKRPELEDSHVCHGMQDYLNYLDQLGDTGRDFNEAKAAEDGTKAKGSEYSPEHITDGWQEFVRGAKLDWRVTIFFPQEPLSLGIFAAGLRSLANAPWLGGHRAAGCGQYGIYLPSLHNPDDFVEITEDLAFRAGGVFQEALQIFDEAAKKGFPGLDFSVLPTPNTSRTIHNRYARESVRE